mmetsp:Transcript_165885/g.527428  ORF Transcript_165885/g.527428 Transcript_165885/m.527428 type:complete len:181 (+) Transcript_165885:187-729(+)
MWVFCRQHVETLLRMILDSPACELFIVCGSLGDEYLVGLLRAFVQSSLGESWSDCVADEKRQVLFQRDGGQHIHLFGLDSVEAAHGGSHKLIAPIIQRMPKFDHRNIVIVDWEKPDTVDRDPNTLYASPYIEDMHSTWAWQVADDDVELLVVQWQIQKHLLHRPLDVHKFVQEQHLPRLR